ncbi:MAG: T9SS C-terminal target domain-containing protein [Ignavibacteriae bacterium]|nr:MAG: T9SS C-terminal target domain-containing protein [Ignavibacteriota bacterium]
MIKILPFNLKKVTIFAALLLLQYSTSANPSSDCSYMWISQSSGTTNILYSVEAVSDLICWASGANATVIRTTDGGITWLNANPNPGVLTGNLINIEATDANNAWTTRFQGTATYIYKTTNGGASWIQVHVQNGGYIFGIHMLSQTHGFAFGDPIGYKWQISVTTNGGFNWSLLPTSPTATAGNQGFPDCFQVSLPYIWFGSYPGQIFRSTDGGNNWSVHNTPGIASVFDIHFISPSLGFASSINMVKSTDTGSTYQPHPVMGSGNIDAIEGFGNNVWYVRGSGIYRSSDSGNNWILEYNTGITQQDIDLPDSNGACLTGWVVGYGGTITKLTTSPVGISNNNYNIPNEYSLEQNYPNPFNPVTTITYSIPQASHVIISLYDVTGKKINGIVDEYKNAGTYNINFDASHLSSGMYFYRLEARQAGSSKGGFSVSKKMMLVK